MNGDGFIQASELHKSLTQRGEHMSMEEAQRLIDEVDENKDGKLDYKEVSFSPFFSFLTFPLFSCSI